MTTIFGAGQLIGPLIAVADRLALAAVPVFPSSVFIAGACAATIDAIVQRR